jgi:hypothetical protein
MRASYGRRKEKYQTRFGPLRMVLSFLEGLTFEPRLKLEMKEILGL